MTDSEHHHQHPWRTSFGEDTSGLQRQVLIRLREWRNTDGHLQWALTGHQNGPLVISDIENEDEDDDAYSLHQQHHHQLHHHQQQHHHQLQHHQQLQQHHHLLQQQHQQLHLQQHIRHHQQFIYQYSGQVFVM